ncbi:RNA polymerase sigma factor [Candidatus Gracilibacteria bacterium]|nr:RNA polymerase sigma factor [Candidatus Gracilibacteria bacterium]
MSEKDLIHKCQAGELDKFGDLYELYIDKIYRFCYLKTSNKDLAEDITSNVFVKALEKIDSFDASADNSSFQAWLYKIAYNKIVDYYRSNNDTPNLEQLMEYHFYKSIDFEKQIDDKDKLTEVREFLNTLKPIHAEIVLLRIWEDLSYEEISSITGKTVDNAKQIFSRSLKKIQANITSLILLLLLI